MLFLEVEGIAMARSELLGAIDDGVRERVSCSSTVHALLLLLLLVEMWPVGVSWLAAVGEYRTRFCGRVLPVASLTLLAHLYSSVIREPHTSSSPYPSIPAPPCMHASHRLYAACLILPSSDSTLCIAVLDRALP